MIFFDFFSHRTEAPFFKGEIRVDIRRHPLKSLEQPAAVCYSPAVQWLGQSVGHNVKGSHRVG